MIVNISYVYDVDDRMAKATYGTTNPGLMAAIDQQAFLEDPSLIVDDLSVHEIQVTVRPDTSSATR